MCSSESCFFIYILPAVIRPSCSSIPLLISRLKHRGLQGFCDWICMHLISHMFAKIFLLCGLFKRRLLRTLKSSCTCTLEVWCHSERSAPLLKYISSPAERMQTHALYLYSERTVSADTAQSSLTLIFICSWVILRLCRRVWIRRSLGADSYNIIPLWGSSEASDRINMTMGRIQRP